nr:hypothetical protein [Tanacetum cinerariifolium]
MGSEMRFLVSDGFYDVFPHTSGVVLEKGIPDHRPILLRENVVDYGPTPFRFFNSWLEMDGFQSLLIFSIDMLVDQGKASKEDIAIRNNSIVALNNMHRLEALDLAQKAKIKWAIEGDENTKFSMTLLKLRGDNLPLKAFEKTVNGLKNLTVTLSPIQSDFLERDFSREEIKRTVWDCGGDRAPGYFPKGCNSSFIALIPKVPNAKFVSDFRPISLIGCQYKIIAMEGLHAITSKADDMGLIKGATFGRDNMNVLHLIYADDVIFLGDWTWLNAHNLISMLQCFFLVSELKINIYRSKVLGVCVSDIDVANMASLLGCGASSFSLKYLGVPVGCNMARCSNWKAIIKKFSSKLSLWKAHLLSVGGRLALIMSVLGNLPIYYMSLYRIPIRVQQNLESIRKNFFSGADQGQKRSHGLNGKVFGKQKLFNNIKEKGIDLLSKNRECLVANWIPLIDWASVLRRSPRGGAELSQFENLQAIIRDIVLSEKCDSWIWSLEASGNFSVASTRHYVDNQTLETSPDATRWSKCILIKANVFIWRLTLNKLPSRLNLHSTGINVSSILCPICHVDVESVNHIFFNCDMAKALWDLLAKWLDLDIPICANISEWFLWLDSLRVSTKMFRWNFMVAYVLVPATCYAVLQNINAAIRQLACDTTPDAFDEYLQMSERTARDSLTNFNKGIISLYMAEYLRNPTLEDVENIYNKHSTTHGFPGMLGSIDCMHWEWKNCPVSWQGQYGARKDVERAFGVLRRWGIIQQPARSYHVNTIRRVMYSCIILHNMILKDQKMAVFDWNEVYANPARNMQRTWIERCETQRRKNK